MKTQTFKGIALSLFFSTLAAPLYGQTVAPAKEPAAPATQVTAPPAQAGAPANPDPNQPAEPSVGEEIGYGFGSVVANLFYIPAKVTYAGLGLLTGGVGYVITGFRGDVANNIIYPAVKGNYVVTPSNLKGTDPLYFVGAPPEPTPPAPNYAAGAPAPKP